MRQGRLLHRFVRGFVLNSPPTFAFPYGATPSKSYDAGPQVEVDYAFLSRRTFRPGGRDTRRLGQPQADLICTPLGSVFNRTAVYNFPVEIFRSLIPLQMSFQNTKVPAETSVVPETFPLSILVLRCEFVADLDTLSEQARSVVKFSPPFSAEALRPPPPGLLFRTFCFKSFLRQGPRILFFPYL